MHGAKKKLKNYKCFCGTTLLKSGVSENNIYKISSNVTEKNTSRLKSVNGGVVVNNTAYCDNHTKTMHAVCRKREKRREFYVAVVVITANSSLKG